MKKKFMMAAVLLGALTLGSCVDDNESASVTAIREAKAAQLKSIADLNNADVKLKEALLESQVAIEAAKARQEEALAAKEEALAKIEELNAKLAEDTYDANLAAELAKAEALKKQAEADLQEAQAEIDTRTISLQRDLATLNLQLIQAKYNLQKEQDNIADKELSDLYDLADTYATALSGYVGMQQSVSAQEATIAGLKADLADWEILKEAQIKAQEYTIEVNKKQIEALKKYTNYTEDLDALRLQLKDAELAMNVAQEEYTKLNKAFNDLDIADLKKAEKVPELRVTVKENELFKLITAETSSNVTYEFEGTNGTETGSIDFNNYIPGTITKNGFILTSEDEEYKYRIPRKDSVKLELEYTDVRGLKVTVEDAIVAIDVKGKADAINTSTTGLQALYDAAVAATKAAKAAWDAAPTDATKKQAYLDAIDAEEIAKTNLETAKSTLETAEENVAKLNAMYALVSDQKLGTELEAAIKAYNEAIVAAYTEKAEASFAKDAAKAEYDNKSIAYTTLDAVVNGNNDDNDVDEVSISLWDLMYDNVNENIFADNVDFDFTGALYNPNYDIWDLVNNDQEVGAVLNSIVINYLINNADADLMGAVKIQEAIELCEKAIKKAEAKIEKLKDTTTQEELIASTQATIDGLTARCEALKIKVEALKTRLDEKMASYSKDNNEPAA